MNRRQDEYLRRSSISDLQDLEKIATNNKEKLDYIISYKKHRLFVVRRKANEIRRSFMAFLRKNDIDTDFPVLSNILADEVYPDTLPENILTSVSIEQALTKNYTEPTFNKLAEMMYNYYPTFQDSINGYVDELKKYRSMQAALENEIEGHEKARENYRDSISKNKKAYEKGKNDLEKLVILKKYLLGFKDIFDDIPDSTTSEDAVRLQDSIYGRYCVHYRTSRKNIFKLTEKLVDSTDSDDDSSQFSEARVGILKDINQYYSLESDSSGEDALPDQYPNAVPEKTKIIDRVNFDLHNVGTLIFEVRAELDSIRGSSDIGNDAVRGLMTSAKEIAQSPVGANVVDQDTYETTQRENQIKQIVIEEKVDEIKNQMDQGLNSVLDNVKSFGRNILRRIGLRIGYSVSRMADRTVNLEDHLREKLRKKYGGIRFCDEVESVDENGNVIFIKESDAVEVAPGDWRKKNEMEGVDLLYETRGDDSLYNV